MSRAEPERHVHGDARYALPFKPDLDPLHVEVLLAAEFALAREAGRVFVRRHPGAYAGQGRPRRAPCSGRPTGILPAEVCPWTRRALLERITYNPQIFGGKPIVRGSRLAVEHVLGMLAAGDIIDTVVSGYPWMEREDVLACLAYATPSGRHRADRAAPRSDRDVKLLLDSCVWGGALTPLRCRRPRRGLVRRAGRPTRVTRRSSPVPAPRAGSWSRSTRTSGSWPSCANFRMRGSFGWSALRMAASRRDVARSGGPWRRARRAPSSRPRPGASASASRAVRTSRSAATFRAEPSMPRTVETDRTTRRCAISCARPPGWRASARRSSSGRLPRRRPRAVIAARAREDSAGHARQSLPPGEAPTTPGASVWARPWPGWHGAGAR